MIALAQQTNILLFFIRKRVPDNLSKLHRIQILVSQNSTNGEFQRF